MTRTISLGIPTALLAAVMIGQATAATVTPEEMREARRWTAAKIEGKQLSDPVEPGLVVLANHDAVHKNARGAKPMRIVNAEFTRGIYCHAVSKIVVRLPKPGKTFSATVGVDTNDQTSGGRGSIVFVIRAAGKEIFNSGVIREGMLGKPVKVDLGGATEFLLEVGDAGDGISCDQADWASAQVTLDDGSTLWLGELPLAAAREPYSVDPPFSFVYGAKPSAELLKTWPRKHEAPSSTPPAPSTWSCGPIRRPGWWSAAWRSSTTISPRSSGRSTSRTPARPTRRSWRTSRRSTRRGSAAAEGEFLLHHAAGSQANRSDYGPRETPLPAGAPKRLVGGRRTADEHRLVVLQPRSAGSEGVIVVVGWPGQWAAEFARDDDHAAPHPRRPGADALQALAGRGGPHAR